MRRTLITALAVLALSIAVCLASSSAVNRTAGRAEALLRQAAAQGDTRAALDLAQAALDDWQAKSGLLEVLTAHDALYEASGAMEDALLCLRKGDQLESRRALGQAVTALERLRAAESLRLMNLF